MSDRYLGLDAWSSAEIFEAMIEGQMAAIAAVRAASSVLTEAADRAAGRLRRGGRLVYVGAGTSGRLAVQDGAELTPTFGWPFERMVLAMAGGEPALLRSQEGVEDDEQAGRDVMAANRVDGDDVVLGVAASGRTRYTIAALEAARATGALTIGMANNPATPVIEVAEFGVLLDTGPEVIAGSTRMKAGTAQKAALNLFSSLVMIRLGHVHDGLMVDVQSLNQKLVKRTEAMVMRLTGCSQAEARIALDQTEGHVKSAALVARGLSAAEARAALERAGGYLRKALAELG